MIDTLTSLARIIHRLRLRSPATEAEKLEWANIRQAVRVMARGYYILTEADVGQSHLRAFGRVWMVVDFMGRILPMDVGKRVYLRGGVLQVESQAQRERHQSTAQPCECTDTGCPVTVADTGKHPFCLVRWCEEHYGEDRRSPSARCGQPAVMHLFRVDMMVHETPSLANEPVDFCEPCGDHAMQSDAFATGEDVAAAKHDPDCAGHHRE